MIMKASMPRYILEVYQPYEEVPLVMVCPHILTPYHHDNKSHGWMKYPYTVLLRTTMGGHPYAIKRAQQRE
jgi:hypothetical protein